MFRIACHQAVRQGEKQGLIKNPNYRPSEESSRSLSPFLRSIKSPLPFGKMSIVMREIKGNSLLYTVKASGLKDTHLVPDVSKTGKGSVFPICTVRIFAKTLKCHV